MEQQSRHELTNLVIPVALILGLALLLGLNTGTGAPGSTAVSPLEDWLKILVGYLAAGAEIAAGLVIGVSILQGLISYGRQLLTRSQPHLGWTEDIRLRLGRALALGLEFTVASDILRTAVAPTRQDILNLGAIVLLRSLLNYFLEREIRQAEVRRAGSGESTSEGA